jgi:integrase
VNADSVDQQMFALLLEQIKELTEKLNKQNESKIIPQTVTELLETVRGLAMIRERKRLGAKVKANGEMAERDTTTYRAYNTHWKWLEYHFGPLPIDMIRVDEIKTFLDQAQDRAQRMSQLRKASTRGNGAAAFNMALDALHAVWQQGLLEKAVEANLLKAIPRQRTVHKKRYALKPRELDEVFEVARSGGKDPILDFVLVWFLSETACRRHGIINLRLEEIDTERQVITLTEKNGSMEEQPITRALMEALLELAAARGCQSPRDKVFRQLPTKRAKRFRDVDGKVFDELFSRVRATLGWADKKGISAHWIRHTTLTWVERTSGMATAAKYARHANATVTGDYTEADIIELAKALEKLTGIPHPLTQE